jgi:hypothetical protein
MIASTISKGERMAQSEYVKISNYDSKAISTYCYENNFLMYAVTHLKMPFTNLCDLSMDVSINWIKSGKPF